MTQIHPIDVAATDDLSDAHERIARDREVFERALGVPFTDGNAVDVLCNGVEIFPAMLDAIEAAEHSIDLLTYIYWSGDIAQRFADALTQRAREGVHVRVILDAFGAKDIAESLVSEMTDAGIEVQWFRPLARLKIWQNDHRTHRKVLVCDGTVSFTGGVGIADEWDGNARTPDEWRDTHFRVRGPAVKGLHSAFLDNWSEMDQRFDDPPLQDKPLTHVGEVPIQILNSSASVRWSKVAMMMRLLVTRARHRLWVSTPYFVPDPRMLELFEEAVGRGVDVRIIMPGPRTDERICQLAGEAILDRLLRAGVTVLRYQPTLIHTKMITVDDHLACIGSANMNQRSMQKDDEVCCIALNESVVSVLNRQFKQDAQRSEPLDLQAWRNRGWLQRAMEKTARLFSSEM